MKLDSGRSFSYYRTMKQPDIISFDGLEVSISELQNNNKQIKGPCPQDWVRVKFKIPLEVAHNGFDAVTKWLQQNNTSRWFGYTFQDPAAPKHGMPDNFAVIKFESKDDAILFKLRDGHQAWKYIKEENR